jgi:hypothetical protein
MAKLALVPMKTRIWTIASAYAAAAGSIIAILSALDPESFDASKGAAAIRRVMSTISSLDEAANRWAPASIRAAYNEGAAVARTRLEAIGMDERRYNPKRHERKIGALTKTVMKDYWDANRTIERAARKYVALLTVASREVRKVEAFADDEDFPYIKRIVKTAKGIGLAESQSRTAVSRKILEHLRRKIGGGDFIEINGRHYNLRAYAELVARTRMREAQTEATKAICTEFDNDLVEIPEHDNPCPECAPYQGQVYSISGNHPKYPPLPDGGPPWHPRCEDVCNPTSENAQRLRNA